MISRRDKVSELIKEEISKLIARKETEGLVTVTGIEISPDFRIATVWISVLGADGGPVIEKLSKNLPEFQSIINKRLTMKVVPRLRFQEDHSQDYVQKIDKLFRQIKDEGR